ncbi:MAG: tRNA lysidine(34) synthetase TilS [Holosporaceae bacterium]|jgi:tRNA(Ile)-lysidine synthase|nr:tRNA lysidine(34) synthetase TilS [Holosporaceae bacterium]
MSIVDNFVDASSTFDAFNEEMLRLVEFYMKLYKTKPLERICVAVSGGSDSMSLLVMAAEWSQKHQVSIDCVTVDHKLREESLAEAKFVENFCKSISVNHRILEWNRGEDKVTPGKLENLARDARYKLISEFCESNSVPLVLVGHTWNDQLETFEMRLNKGSSAGGLAGMSQIRSITDRVKLIRPILHFTKEHLEHFLKSKNILWKIDPMNHQETFLRVFHRKKISRYSSDKILDISNRIVRLGTKRNEIETSAVCFLKSFCEFPKRGHAIIDKKQLLLEEKTIQAEVLKRIIWNVGEKKYAPRINEDLCDNILRQKINTLGRCLLKIKKEKIFVLRENRNAKAQKELPGGLPCTFQNHRMTYEINESSNDFSCFKKINLFDVFL